MLSELAIRGWEVDLNPETKWDELEYAETCRNHSYYTTLQSLNLATSNYTVLFWTLKKGPTKKFQGWYLVPAFAAAKVHRFLLFSCLQDNNTTGWCYSILGTILILWIPIHQSTTNIMIISSTIPIISSVLPDVASQAVMIVTNLIIIRCNQPFPCPCPRLFFFFRPWTSGRSWQRG